MKNQKRKAFTLIELIVVIAILALLAAVAIPRYSASKNKAAITAHKTNVQILRSAATMAIANGENNFEWDNDSKDKWEDYIEKYPTVPKEVSADSHYKVKVTDGEISITPDENASLSQSENTSE